MTILFSILVLLFCFFTASLKENKSHTTQSATCNNNNNNNNKQQYHTKKKLFFATYLRLIYVLSQSLDVYLNDEFKLKRKKIQKNFFHLLILTIFSFQVRTTRTRLKTRTICSTIHPVRLPFPTEHSRQRGRTPTEPAQKQIPAHS
jgi:hypothetical protein